MDRIEKIDDRNYDLGFRFSFVTSEGVVAGHYVPTRSTLERLAEIAECPAEEILAESEDLLHALAKTAARKFFADYYFSVGQRDKALEAAKADYGIRHALPM